MRSLVLSAAALALMASPALAQDPASNVYGTIGYSQVDADGVDLALPVAGRDDEAQRPERERRRRLAARRAAAARAAVLRDLRGSRGRRGLRRECGDVRP